MDSLGKVTDDDHDVIDATLAQRGDLIAKDRLTCDWRQALRNVGRMGQQAASRSGRKDDGGSRMGHELMQGFKRRTVCDSAVGPGNGAKWRPGCILLRRSEN